MDCSGSITVGLKIVWVNTVRVHAGNTEVYNLLHKYFYMGIY